jgi:hypothetical protein
MMAKRRSKPCLESRRLFRHHQQLQAHREAEDLTQWELEELVLERLTDLAELALAILREQRQKPRV